MSAAAATGDHKLPHVVLLPSAGMGHLAPFLRLASALSSKNYKVTFIAPHPTVTAAESHHLSTLRSSLPQIHHLPFPLLPFDPATVKSSDPFYLHCESIRRSAHLLPTLLSRLSPPISSLILDISLTSAFLPIAADLRLPTYILFTSSATMLTLFAHIPNCNINVINSININIPGIPPLPKSMIPPALHDPSNLFTKQFMENGRALLQSDGIIVNTFESLEPDALAALNGGLVVKGLPPVVAVGPLKPPPSPKGGSGTVMAWLDEQPAKSVVYVSFGSRTAMSREQIKELGIGLERSGWRFLWVVKSKMVDREEEEEEEDVVEEGFLERVKGRGLVVKGWVEQEEILSHEAVGGFVSHCGWNSAVEACAGGVRVVAWPRAADQRVNARVVEGRGVGVWVREWGWEGEGVVCGVEIGEVVRRLMEDARVGECVARVMEEAGREVGVGGRSYEGLMGLIQQWRGGRDQ